MTGINLGAASPSEAAEIAALFPTEPSLAIALVRSREMPPHTEIMASHHISNAFVTGRD